LNPRQVVVPAAPAEHLAAEALGLEEEAAVAGAVVLVGLVAVPVADAGWMRGRPTGVTP
jgi:hypothetical protein